MKNTINLLLSLFLTQIKIYLNLIFIMFNTLNITYFFSWRTSNFADSYWFLYDNKKYTYEKITVK